MVKDYLNYMKVKVQILSYNIEIRITIIKDLFFNYINARIKNNCMECKFNKVNGY